MTTITGFDPDELERTLPPAPPRGERTTRAEGTDAGDEPPIVLDAYGLEVWQGRRPAWKRDNRKRIIEPHVTDISDTLYKIGATLHEAGLMPRANAAALAERDRTLEYNKYVDRPDEYDRIAEKFRGKPRKARPQDTATATGGCPEKDARIAALEAEVTEIRRQRDHAWERCNEAERRLRAYSHVQSNTELSPGLRSTAAALARHLDGAEWDGKGPRDDGWKHISRPQLAATAGVSVAAISAHLKVFAARGLIGKRSPRTLSETSPSGYATEMLIQNKAGGSAVDFLEAVASYQPPDQDDDRLPGEKRRGSAAPRCVNDGCTANLKRIPGWVCPDCGESYAEDDPRLTPEAEPEAEGVMSQITTSLADQDKPAPPVAKGTLESYSATSPRRRPRPFLREVKSQNGTSLARPEMPARAPFLRVTVAATCDGCLARASWADHYGGVFCDACKPLEPSAGQREYVGDLAYLGSDW